MLEGEVVYFNSGKGYGFIKVNGEDKDIFFHYSSIKTDGPKIIEIGEMVKFDCIQGNRGMFASNIIREKITQSDAGEQDDVFPGINHGVRLKHFEDEERKIIDKIGLEFYVTNGGAEIKLGAKSIYRYFLVKPITKFRELFNLKREIVVLFSPYDRFEPRTLDAIDVIPKLHQRLRIDKICSIIISQDIDIERRLSEVIKHDTEMQIIIPFSYSELLKEQNNYFMIQRFRKYFYERDLFAFESPLKRDLYFFGRNDLVHTLLNRHLSSENSGVFGLRKSGKTSILYGVERALEKIDGKSIWVDCQRLHFKRWNHALFYIIEQLFKKYSQAYDLHIEHSEDHYAPEKAPDLFEEDVTYLYNKFDKKPILLFIDEIEQITFNISIQKHWREGNDFIKFWHVIRL